LKKELSRRGFIALSVFWSFIVETISGLVLYIVPQGSVSRWTNWKLLGLNHSDWVALHTIFGYIFLFFAVFHIVYNWKSIMYYIERKVQHGIEMPKELILSLFLCVVLTAGILLNWAPFRAVLNLEDTIKKSWPGGTSTPIASHAERMTFEEFARESNVGLQTALNRMHEAGYKLEESRVLIINVTKKYGLAPIEIHQIITKEVKSGE
jgi:hypothetical protein